MTIDELNALLESIVNEPTNDVAMLEGFDKIRAMVEEMSNQLKDAVLKVEEITKKYEDLRQAKVRDFFNRNDEENDVDVEEVKEEVKDEVVEGSDIDVEDLFEDDVEVMGEEIIEEREDL